MIKVIGFDLEGVLIKDTALSIEKKFWNKNISAAAKSRYVKALHDVDTGRAGEKHIIEAIQQNLAPHWSKAKIQREVHNTKILPPWKLLKQLENNYHIAILTNNYRNAPSIYARLLNISFAKYTVVNSSMIGVKKPAATFYRVAFKKLRVKPEEMLFIDDRVANIAGAKKLGVKTFHFNNNMPKLRVFLKRHGITGL